jgi:hypothetical protein
MDRTTHQHKINTTYLTLDSQPQDFTSQDSIKLEEEQQQQKRQKWNN